MIPVLFLSSGTPLHHIISNITQILIIESTNIYLKVHYTKDLVGNLIQV